MTSMKKRRLCVCGCGKVAQKAGLSMPCYNRQHYQHSRPKAPGSGKPVRVKGWGRR